MKKVLLSLGTVAVVATPVVAVVSCSDDSSSDNNFTLLGDARGIEISVENNVITDVKINTFVLQNLSQVRDAFSFLTQSISGNQVISREIFGSDIDVTSFHFEGMPEVELRGPRINLLKKEWNEFRDAQKARVKGEAVEFGFDTTIAHRVILTGITSEQITANFNQFNEFISFTSNVMASGSGIETALNAIRTSINANKDQLLLGIDTTEGTYKDNLSQEDQDKFDEALEKTMFNPLYGELNDDGTQVNVDYFNAPSFFGKDDTNAPENYMEYSKAIIIKIINQPLDFDMSTLLDESSKRIVDNYRHESPRDVVALEKAEVAARTAALADPVAKPLVEAVNSAYNAVVLDNRVAKPLLDAYLEALNGSDDEEKTNTLEALKQNQLGNTLVEAVIAANANTLAKAWVDAKIAYINH